MITAERTIIMRTYKIPVVTQAITATVLYQVCVSVDEDKNLDVDIDVIDYEDVTFMGMSIGEGYNSFNSLRTKLQEIGVNIGVVLCKEADKQINKEYVLGDMFEIIKCTFGK